MIVTATAKEAMLLLLVIIGSIIRAFLEEPGWTGFVIPRLINEQALRVFVDPHRQTGHGVVAAVATASHGAAAWDQGGVVHHLWIQRSPGTSCCTLVV